MSYMPADQPRCTALKCSQAKTCARNNCPPGGGHPVADLSAKYGWTDGGCYSYVYLTYWTEPKKAGPKPKTHECPEGLL